MAAKDLYEKDFYKILGLAKSASGDEIKKKYRSLARELHPDKTKGDTAMEEANYLTRFASKVTILHRRNEFRASKIMLERCQNNAKIEFVVNTTVDEYIGEILPSGIRKLTSLKLRNTVTNEENIVPADGIFVAIGHKPNTDLFKGLIDMDETGYIQTVGKSSYTNIEGVFACGDAQDSVYRQAVTAAGSGCMAAIDAERWLEAQHG